MMASDWWAGAAACTLPDPRRWLVLAAAHDLGLLISSSWHLLGGMRHSVCLMIVLACIFVLGCCCRLVCRGREIEIQGQT
jgi:hypothetical protein